VCLLNKLHENLETSGAEFDLEDEDEETGIKMHKETAGMMETRANET
jgi:hypothetical protein